MDIPVRRLLTEWGSPEPYTPGTLHHVHVITGKLRIDPLNEPVDLSAGDFVRFPGDVPHRVVCLSEAVTAHMVTTIPQVRRVSPRVTRGGVEDA